MDGGGKRAKVNGYSGSSIKAREAA